MKKQVKIGIYSIINKINNKIYIGYSIDVDKRLETHRNKLIRGKHENEHLQKSVFKYGIENFDFDEIEQCEEQFLASQEHYWCMLLDCHNRDKGYNIRPTHPHNYQRQSEETKQKLKHSIRTDVSKIILQFTKDGVFVREWSSIAAAVKELKDTQICSCLTKVAIYAANSLWRYKTEYNGDRVVPRKNLQKREIIQYDLNGNILGEFNSIIEASKIQNIHRSSIVKSLIQKRAIYKKYIFKYKEDK